MQSLLEHLKELLTEPQLLVESINGLLWGHLLIYMLLFAGVWFSFSLKLVQLREFGHMFTLLKRSRGADDVGISSFQALCTSLSARVGTGNLAGVAIAISVGGPGAIFWMWVIALLGMATAFAESTLAQVYKVKDANGEFRGGPAYYIQLGLGSKAAGMVFALALLFGYTLVFNANQANTIVDALNHSYQLPKLRTGLIITALAAIVVMGGFRSIARVSEILVPIMALAFIGVAVLITLLNISAVPGLLLEIVKSAFGLQEAAGATSAVAIQNGIKRGLFSNEAGAGSVPQAAAAASPNPNHPVTQGYIQMLGVFIDTILICTCTAIVVMLAGNYVGIEMEGIRLTQNAMTFHLGSVGGHFIAVAITLFAFTSIIGNYAYAESNLHFFNLDNTVGRTVFTALFLTMTLLGTQAELGLVWGMADMAFGIMAVINVVAIIFLTPTLISVFEHYQSIRRSNRTATFVVSDVKLQGNTAREVWPASQRDKSNT